MQRAKLSALVKFADPLVVPVAARGVALPHPPTAVAMERSSTPPVTARSRKLFTHTSDAVSEIRPTGV
jgi:hypothetical protein